MNVHTLAAGCKPVVSYNEREAQQSKKETKLKDTKNEIQNKNEDLQREAKEREVKCIKAIHDAPIKGSE